MQGSMNPKVLGAFLIGFALVALSYTWNSFGSNSLGTTTALYVVTEAAPERLAISVVDTNNDGVEDWKETFIEDVPTLQLEETADPDYTREDTLTEEVSIQFMENVLRAKGYGEFGPSQEEVVESTVNRMSLEAVDTFYTERDIIVTTNDDINFRSYGNLAANAILDNNDPNLETEALSLEKAVVDPSEENIANLRGIAAMYRATRDSTLNIPVPASMVQQHLNLVNAYHALSIDAEAMAKVDTDPMLTMVRLKRYQEDVDGMALALRDIYRSLEPKADLFTVEDPAVLFVAFSDTMVAQ